ncbi:MAG: NAD(P)H-hydrate dehydratase [Bacteroidales bacterium]|nr:NAD(P)H-hydrate dehydratase [Bacteroidales bacterium]
MKLFFSNNIKEIDSLTVEEENISLYDLMERASGAVADEVMARWSQKTPVVVFAGPGNNGGDALAVARIMAEAGYSVQAYLFNPKGKLTPDCLKNKAFVERMENVEFSEIVKEFNPPVLDEDTLVIDGLFGSGLNQPIVGGFASVIQYINESHSKVVSIDMPSGYFCEDNTNNNFRNIIRANLTLTFQFPKFSFMFSESEKYTGEVVVLDINLSRNAINKISTSLYLTERFDAAKIIKPRSRFAHKGKFGHALIVAGSYGKIGACVLASKGCLHSGVGLLTVHSAGCANNIIQTSVPEAMFDADKQEKIVSEINNINTYNSIGFGPGLGTDSNTEWALENAFKQINRPCVVDADAINIIAKNNHLLSLLPSYSILTPHPKEFERLFGACENSFQRLNKAIEVAINFKFIIILKGAFTAVVLPNGEVHFNSSGNPGMATGGSGDTLTGIITALLSQNYTPAEAAILGTYVHGMAADIALTRSSEESLSAGDIIDNLGHAFRQLRLAK